jgi:hypothetical protein
VRLTHRHSHTVAALQPNLSRPTPCPTNQPTAERVNLNPKSKDRKVRKEPSRTQRSGLTLSFRVLGFTPSPRDARHCTYRMDTHPATDDDITHPHTHPHTHAGYTVRRFGACPSSPFAQIYYEHVFRSSSEWRGGTPVPPLSSCFKARVCQSDIPRAPCEPPPILRLESTPCS